VTLRKADSLTFNLFDRVVLAFVAIVAGVFAGDYLGARLRLPHSLQTVEVRHFLAVPLKSGKYEFDYTGSENVPCVVALFPHFGQQPCWYLQRHRDQNKKL
jgi:hypothetical protein